MTNILKTPQNDFLDSPHFVEPRIHNGVRLFDTASVYRNEQALGEAIKAAIASQS
jgi:diketogulonate reductase-like aldo/keto reductase